MIPRVWFQETPIAVQRSLSDIVSFTRSREAFPLINGTPFGSGLRNGLILSRITQPFGSRGMSCTVTTSTGIGESVRCIYNGINASAFTSVRKQHLTYCPSIFTGA